VLLRAGDDLAEISRPVGKIFLTDGSIMTDKKKKQKKTPYQNWLVPGAIGLVFLTGIGFLVKVMLTDVGTRSKEKVQTVTLLKPPPPEVKEKPPEPEVPKEVPKQTIETPVDTPQPQNQAQDQSQDNTPAGSDLGVDGEGGAGSDGFGLVGKKGGRALTLGGGSGGMNRLSLLTKYGWYTQKIQEEIKAQVRKQLNQDGGIPKGKLQAVVKIVLDAKGKIVRYEVVGSSGNKKMDEALRTTLAAQIRISEPPPEGMPTGMTVRINSQG
jgi:TonB family protein